MNWSFSCCSCIYWSLVIQFFYAVSSNIEEVFVWKRKKKLENQIRFEIALYLQIALIKINDGENSIQTCARI